MIFSEYMPSSGIAGWYSNFTPSSLRNLHTILHSGCIHLHSHQLCKSISIPPHPLQHLLLVDFLIMAVLTSVRYLIADLVCISLIMSNIQFKWLYKYLQAILQRRQGQPTAVFLPGKSDRWRSLVGCSPWSLEESDTTERLHFHFSLSCIGEGNDNPLQCSCLENPRDGGSWWATVHGVTQSQTRLKWLGKSSSRLSNFVSWSKKPKMFIT